MGPSAEQVVKFEPEGVRITLPPDFPKAAPTGLATGLTIKGDFEITVGFEILKDELPGDPSAKATRLTVMAGWEMAGHNCFKITRSLGPRGNAQFVAHLHYADKGKHDTQMVNAGFKSGKLRVIRHQGAVSFYVSDGGEFVLIHEKDFVPGDLDNVRVVAILNDDKASLDVRITEFTIKADGIVKGPTAPESRIALWKDDGRALRLPVEPGQKVVFNDAGIRVPAVVAQQTNPSHGWLAAGLIIGVFVLLALVISLAVLIVVYLRSTRDQALKPTQK
jgi:Protein of unknown function (DUF1583) C domain